VVETGANAADASSATRDVLVIATAATVESHAYAAACAERKMQVIEKACPLLVPLVEEGWTEHPVTDEVVRIYMGELMEQAENAGMNADTLVLACTHYPLLRATIERAVPQEVSVIDSAEVTAQQVASRLAVTVPTTGTPDVQFFATDSVAKFRELGTRFLGQAIPAVRLVDLGG
jgi:glutamate racemase